jgi:hypothetical protein
LIDHTDHLAAAELAAYFDGGLTQDARARIDDHLERCASCRAELNASASLADSWAKMATPFGTKRRNHGRLVAIALPAGLAAAMLLMVAIPRQRSVVDETNTLRAAELYEGRAAITPARPAGGSDIPPADRNFVWHRSDASS